MGPGSHGDGDATMAVAVVILVKTSLTMMSRKSDDDLCNNLNRKKEG